jgi:hypothetical protein
MATSVSQKMISYSAQQWALWLVNKISVTVSVSVQDFSVLFNNDVHPVICESWQFSHMWKALAWTIISRRVEIWVHFTRLTPPPFIEVPVQSKESERSCICVVGVSTLPLSTTMIFNFETLPTVWYFFAFHFITC